MDETDSVNDIKGIWLTWERQRRNTGISSSLGWKLFEIAHNKSRAYRYTLCSIKTISIILKERPDILVVQNPSIVLCSIALLSKKIFRYKLIIDSHNSGIFPVEGRSKLLMCISKLLQRYASLTLVSNEYLKTMVQENEGIAFVLPDRIPIVPQTRTVPLAEGVNVLYICTFSEDEPYAEVLKAARLLPENATVYFTGKYEGKLDTSFLPQNVRLLGFVPEQKYWSLLSSADLVMDLTTREGCLVCGAYEGIAMSKPLVLSDTEALRSYFNRGCIYVAPTADSIAKGIKSAIENYDNLVSEIEILKTSLKQDWKMRLKLLKCAVSSLIQE